MYLCCDFINSRIFVYFLEETGGIEEDRERKSREGKRRLEEISITTRDRDEEIEEELGDVVRKQGVS